MIFHFPCQPCWNAESRYCHCLKLDPKECDHIWIHVISFVLYLVHCKKYIIAVSRIFFCIFSNIKQVKKVQVYFTNKTYNSTDAQVLNYNDDNKKDKPNFGFVQRWNVCWYAMGRTPCINRGSWNSVNWTHLILKTSNLCKGEVHSHPFLLSILI